MDKKRKRRPGFGKGLAPNGPEMLYWTQTRPEAECPGDQEEFMLTFNHFNFNVADLDKSLAFYKEALGLEPVGERKVAADGSFIIVYLGDGKTDFRLELTWLRDHPQKYDLGECEFHLALRAEDYEAAHAKHAAMGCICFENPAMGIYFVTDPDGYWIEIIPTR